MHDDGQRIDFLAVEQDVDLDHVGGPELLELVVHGRIAARYRFQLVEEIQHDFAQRHFVGQHDLLAVIGHVQLHAPLLVRQGHDRAHIVLRHIKMHGDDGFANLVDLAGVGNLGRVFNLEDIPIGLQHFVHHAGRSSDQILVELALQTLLDDFHVQEAEETATESKTQRLADLGFVMQGGVVQLELFKRIAQRFVLAGL